MQFDHVLLYMSFGSCIALCGFILAILAKSGEGHGSLEVLGLSISLQAAGGILVIGIGAVTFLMPMIMGRDLNQSAEIQHQSAEIQRLHEQVASLNSEKDVLRGQKIALENEKNKLSSDLSSAKSVPIEDVLRDLNYVTHVMDRDSGDTDEACARKMAKTFSVGKFDMLHLGVLVGVYEDGVAIIDCRKSIYMIGVAKDNDDARGIVEDVKAMVGKIYPGANK